MVYDIASPHFWGKKRLGVATPSLSGEFFFPSRVFLVFFDGCFLRNDVEVLGELEESIRKAGRA